MNYNPNKNEIEFVNNALALEKSAEDVCLIY
jgi:hypothetical protein